MSHPAPPTMTLREQLLALAGGSAAVGLVVLLTYATPRITGGQNSARAIFALGFLLLGGMVLGQVAAIFRLPRLTGFLAAGVIAGPHAVGLFGPSEVESLALINTLALALIALQAGAEFTVEMLQKGFRSLFFASLMQTVIVGPGLVVLYILAKPLLPFMEGTDWPEMVALALLWGAIGVSKSPTAVLAVLAEIRAKGPVTNYSLALVVAFDVLVLVLFAVAMTVARVLLEPGAEISLHDFAALGEELVASIAAGTTFGLLLAGWLWGVRRERTLFIVVVAYGVTAFCRYFHYDTLLVFVIAGFIVQNFSKQGPQLIATAEKLSGAVMVIFFATAGASLDLGALKSSWMAALLLVFVRGVLTWGAAVWGSKLANDPPVIRRYGWTSLISQVGVTIGLLTVAAEKLPPSLGTGFVALGIAVVGINTVLGPIINKWGITRAGENPESPPAEEPKP